jgi:extracellular elastinolytic metalloproteinase
MTEWNGNKGGRARLRVSIGLVVLAVSAVGAANSAAVSPQGSGGSYSAVAAPAAPLADFDVRNSSAGDIPEVAAVATAELRRELGPGGTLTLDPVTGTVRVLASADGFLTPASSADPATIALGFVSSHLQALGLGSGDLTSLSPLGSHTSPGGLTYVNWVQSVDGIRALDNGLEAVVDSEGHLVNLTGSLLAGLALHDASPVLGATEALSRAQDSARDPDPTPAVLASSGGAQQATRFADGSQAGLVLFGAPDGAQVSWRVLEVKGPNEIYDTVVDASSGKVLRRENIIDRASGRVWEYFPEADACCIIPVQGGDGGGPAALKPFPGSWGTEASRLAGTNVYVYTDVDDNANTPPNYGPDASNLCGGASPCGDIPPNAGNDWNYVFQPEPDNFFNCDALFPQCSWDPFTSFSWTTNVGQNATQVYYYVNRFHDWLAASPFGFGAGEGFEGADRVNAQVFDGAATDSGLPNSDHINNANMATFPGIDTPPRMQMFLFFGEPSGYPDVNGGDHAGVMYHEYTHGLSNRLVTDVPGQPTLDSHQADSMGEGWSDWYALDYLESNSIDEDDREGPPDPTAGPGGGDNDGEMNLAFYMNGFDLHGLRTMGLDCAAASTDFDCVNDAANQAGPGGYSYGDMGLILCTSGRCPEVHADGEIWAQTLWDLRQRFRADLSGGGAFVDAHEPGLDRVRQLITEGMRLAPNDPSFLDARNAILQADHALFGDADRTRIWDVFAARGMGYFAATLSSADTQPVENFEVEPNCGGGACGSVTGTVTEELSGARIPNATVELLGTGNLFATTNSSGVYTINNVPPHSYPYVVVSAPGHDTALESPSGTLGAGTTTLNLTLLRDWAAIVGGARVAAFSAPDYSSNGCGPAKAFDIDLGTTWGSTNLNPADSSNGPGGAKQVTVALPRRLNLASFGIDPGAGCGDDDTSSLGHFTIFTSNDGSNFTRAGSGDFVAADNHQLNPLAPTSPLVNVRFVSLVMQGTQGPPTSGTSAANFMDMSEFEVYGRPSPRVRCGGRVATIVGTPRANTLRGTARADVIAGLGGNDRISGLGRSDTICGGPGRDRLSGGAGADRLLGDAGVDTLTGGPGRDTCTGGPGRREVARTCEVRRTL